MRARRGVTLLAVACLALSTASAWAQPRAPGLRPAPETDEGGMWDSFDRAEQQARAASDINPDAALQAYVGGVACKVAADHCDDIRVYVLDRPFMQATMGPNGYTEVWSGMMLRARDEAELAFVLGHEAGHFIENHSIERYRAHKTRSNVVLAVSVAVAVAGVAATTQTNSIDTARAIRDATDALIDAVYLAGVASYFSFSRKNEEEADRLGFGYAIRAGYAPAAGAALWRSRLAETAASDFERVRRGPTRTSIFDSHPLEIDRVLALDTLASAAPGPGEDGRARYRAAIRPHLGAWLKDDLRRRDYGQTLHLIDRLAADGEDLGVLAFYRGEAYRRRRGTDDGALALAAYEAASRQPDAPTAVWRELGDLQLKAGRGDAARLAYAAYLDRAADAQDRWLVEANLKKLTGAGGS